MPTNKKIFIITGALLSFILPGCLTVKIADAAKNGRRSETVQRIHSAYRDSANSLVINFTAKLRNHKGNSAYHVKLNTDTALYYFSKSKARNVSADTAVKISQRINYMSLTDKTDNGFYIEYYRDIIKPDFLLKNDTTIKDIANVTSYSKKKKFRFTENASIYPSDQLHAKHIVFIVPEDTSLQLYKSKHEYIVISIEPSGKLVYEKYALVPLTIAGDIITLPVQLVIGTIIFIKLMKGMPAIS